MPDYNDSMAGNQRKYLALVPPAAPTRIVDLGTLTQGLTLNPAAQATPVGTTFFDLPRWPLIYKHLILRIRGGVGGAAAAGGGTLTNAYKRRDFLRLVELTMNGGDKFQSISGSSLFAWNMIQGLYRNAEVPGADTTPAAAPGAGLTVTYDNTWKIGFHDALLYPRLFSLLNPYEGHGVNALQMQVQIGALADWLTGDAGALVTVTDVQLSASVMDYGMMAGFGEPYVRETTFARLEIREQRGIVLANATDQRTILNRGMYVRGYLVVDLDASTNSVPNANNITQITLQRDTVDVIVNHHKIPHLQRRIADKYSNCFAQNLTHVYFVDLCPDQEPTQLLNTYNMVQWDMLLTSGAAGSARIVELQQNVPIARMPRKNSNTVVGAGARGPY